MRIFDSKPVLRWMAPLAFVLVAAGGGLVAVNASADDKLAPREASQLLTDLQGPTVDGFSGTIVQKSALGLPDIPGAGTSDLTSLLSGSHTLRVWYSGPDKARVALVSGDFAESDVVTNGTDLWTWNSQNNEATHRTLDKTQADKTDGPAAGRTPSADVPKTPQEAAAWALKALEPSTVVTTDSDVTVAKQQAYELVLRPKDKASTMKEVRIAIDGKTHLPLRVQAFGSGNTVVFSVEYTTIDYAQPDNVNFTFNPPKDAKVTQVPESEHKAPTPAERNQAKQRAEDAQSQTKTVGSGWTTVKVIKLPANAGQNNAQLQGFLQQLQPTPDGKGKLFTGPAFSAVLTDDGRLAVGAVQPDLLYEALAK